MRPSGVPYGKVIVAKHWPVRNRKVQCFSYPPSVQAKGVRSRGDSHGCADSEKWYVEDVGHPGCGEIGWER